MTDPIVNPDTIADAILQMDEFTAEDLMALSKGEREAIAEMQAEGETADPEDPAEADPVEPEVPDQVDPAPQADAEPDADAAEAAVEAEPASEPAPEPAAPAAEPVTAAEAADTGGIDPLPAMRAAQEAEAEIAALEQTISKAVEDFEQMEITAADFQKANKSAMADLRAAQQKLDKAASDFAVGRDDWVSRLETLYAAHPALKTPEHEGAWDQALRAVEQARPDMSPQARINLAFQDYAAKLASIHRPLPSLVAPAKPAAPAAAQPAKSVPPKPVPAQPPRTLASVPSESALDSMDGGEFSHIMTAIDSGDVTAAEKAMGDLSEAEFERLSKRLA